ncbi:MAG: PadR family transcriptional regulator [Actinomycetota bacterium]|nr:PadR family transcriptional regulator [Actinomycetota bacterium]
MLITGRGHRQGEGDLRHGRLRPTYWQLTAPVVLLLLTGGPSHGYELLGRLQGMLPRNVAPPDASGLYRLLRGMEGDELLRSNWTENPGAGPRRRIYELTDSGRDMLDSCASSIAGEIHAMSGLLAAYYGATTDQPR